MSNQNPYQGIPDSSVNPSGAYDIRGGIDFSAGQINFIRTIVYTVLGWATLGIEVFIRKNFGERYLTSLNFFVGYLFLSSMMFTSSIFNVLQGGFMPDNPNEDQVYLPFLISFLYLCFGAYHFWMLWVKRQLGRHEYSYHDGDSHLLRFGELLMRVINPLVIVVAKLFASFTVNRKDRELLSSNFNFLPPIYDAEEFTKKWVEPIMVIIIGTIPGIPFVWTVICAIAISVHSRMSYSALRKLHLDSSDARIKQESVKYDRTFIMKKLRMEYTKRSIDNHLNNDMKTKDDIVEEIKADNPDLSQALEELNINLGGNSSKPPIV